MKKINLSLICLLFSVAGFSQLIEPELSPMEKLEHQVSANEEAIQELRKLKISGYIQAQYQLGEKNASLKVGSANEAKDDAFNRVGIRRGRVKIAYEEGVASGVFQLDITEKGLGLKDAYLNIKDPWVGTNAVRAGVFDRPFGYEISYSSSRRESPERSTIFQTLFPDERDLGGMLVLQAAKTSPLNFLKLEAGLFAGNGIKQDNDNRKDFIGHISANRNLKDNIKLALGASYYGGSVYQGTANRYEMDGKSFVLNSDPANKGKYAKREYVGVDGQFVLISPLGMTQLRGEYLFGTQPGAKSGSKSPNAATLPNADTYIRDFGGGYLMLVQDFGNLPFSAILKYDSYDPNVKVAGNEVGENGTDKGDVAFNTLGAGLLWRVNNNVRVQAYYDFVKNETSVNLADYNQDVKDNLFTLHVQYKF